MNYWLVKSEPETWSFEEQKKKGVEMWDGVRNYQAANNLKSMKVGDLAFFYHSGKEKQIVGIVQCVKTAYIDPTDPTDKFVAVDFAFQEQLPNPVTLQTIKMDPRLSDIALVRQSRLSVMPLDSFAWDIIYKLGQSAYLNL